MLKSQAIVELKNVQKVYCMEEVEFQALKKIITLLLAILIFQEIAFAYPDSLSVTIDMSTNRIDYNSTFNYTSSLKISDTVTKINENEYFLAFSFKSPRDLNFNLKFILPEDAVLSEKNGALVVSRPVFISTDGRRISLEWSQNISQDSQSTYFAQYNTRNYQSIDLIPIIIVIFLIIGIFIGYKLKKFKKEKFIKEAVSEDERKILNEIMKKGKILQEDLRESTSWSKTKVSKIVRNLEAKGIIQKIPYRKTNKLKLK